jgi:hypothetical protein
MTDDLYSYTSEQPTKAQSCSDDIYPCCITDNAIVKCFKGCEQQLDGRSCDDCLWICFPITITLDIILFIPETICYIYNKCK